MSENKRKDGIIRRVVSALETAPHGSQELDCMISYALELARGEFDQVMMELLVNEGFSWNVISEIWEGKVAPYTQSLDRRGPSSPLLASAVSKSSKPALPGLSRTMKTSRIRPPTPNNCVWFQPRDRPEMQRTGRSSSRPKQGFRDSRAPQGEAGADRVHHPVGVRRP